MVYEFLLVHDKTSAELDFMLSCFLQPDILIKAFIKNQKAYHYLADRPFLSLAMDGLYIVVVTRTEDAVGTSRNMLLGIALFFHFVLALSTSTITAICITLLLEKDA